MSVVREANGAQVLPRADEPRQTITSHAAYCAIDADHRRKYPTYAHLAARLYVYASPSSSTEEGADHATS